jgi:hypothetical protein
MELALTQIDNNNLRLYDQYIKGIKYSELSIVSPPPAMYTQDAIYFATQEPITPWLGADTAKHYQWYPFITLVIMNWLNN